MGKGNYCVQEPEFGKMERELNGKMRRGIRMKIVRDGEWLKRLLLNNDIKTLCVCDNYILNE